MEICHEMNFVVTSKHRRLSLWHPAVSLETTDMMTSSNGNICRVTGHVCGEFTGHRWIPAQRTVTRSFDVFFDLRLNKRLSKQSWGWWFETPSRSFWRHCNVALRYHYSTTTANHEVCNTRTTYHGVCDVITITANDYYRHGIHI